MWWLYDGNIDNVILYGMGNILYKTVYIYEYWDNGNKKFVGSEKSGERHGLWTYWYENGQTEQEETYKDGKEDGLWTSWYENGEKEYEGTYKDEIGRAHV